MVLEPRLQLAKESLIAFLLSLEPGVLRQLFEQGIELTTVSGGQASLFVERFDLFIECRQPRLLAIQIRFRRRELFDGGGIAIEPVLKRFEPSGSLRIVRRSAVAMRVQQTVNRVARNLELVLKVLHLRLLTIKRCGRNQILATPRRDLMQRQVIFEFDSDFGQQRLALTVGNTLRSFMFAEPCGEQL